MYICECACVCLHTRVCVLVKCQPQVLFLRSHVCTHTLYVRVCGIGTHEQEEKTWESFPQECPEHKGLTFVT